MAWAAVAGAEGVPEFMNVTVSPTPFSPNGDGIRDQVVITYELSDTATSVTVAVKDSEDELISTLYGGLPQSAGVTHRLTWDGRDQLSTPAPDGLYTILFASSNDSGQDSHTKHVKLDSTRPQVMLSGLSHVPFTPDLPGTPDSLQVSLTVSGSNTLDTPDSLSVAVVPKGQLEGDTLVVNPRFAGDGNYEAYWKPVDRQDGEYLATAHIEDDAGNSDTDFITFDLDTAAPLVGITAPQDGSVFMDLPDSAFGMAYDPQGVLAVEISYDSGEYYPATFTAKNDTGFWSAALPDAEEVAGDHVIAARATDSVMHTGAGGDLSGPSSITITIDNEAPPTPTLDALPDFVRSETLEVTGAAPQAVFVSLYLNDMSNPAKHVDVSISGFFEATLVLQPGENSIAASATDVAGNSSGLSSPLTVEYTREFGVFFNERFRPGDSFELSLEEEARSATIAIYAMSGRMVRVLRADGPSKTFSIRWDGADHTGESAGNGIYLCRVSAVLGSGDEITDKKLVALVR